jgi:hypothetical protein
MPALLERRSDRSAGFVLVGVVMFVLALTILGLSLFGLSSYEAQFYQRSADRSQAFYSALGGIERAKFVLASQGKLSLVKAGLPLSGVTYARAVQDTGGAATDSSGLVVWDPNDPITIRVLAVEQDSRVLLESSFRPKPQQSYYRRLVTSFGGLSFGDSNISHQYTGSQTHLYGEDWQAAKIYPGWSLMAAVPALTGPPPGPPAPDIPGYLQAHISLAVDAPAPSAGVYHLDSGSGTIRLYRSIWNPVVDPRFSLHDQGVAPGIAVTDTVIWMFDHGAAFIYGATVTGPPSACLILVSHLAFDPSDPYDPDLAIGFNGGLTSEAAGHAQPGPAIILVADGKVLLEKYSQGATSASNISYLSIYAGNISVIGPSSVAQLNFTHPTNNSDPRDLPGGLIDRLAQLGYLPGENSGASGKFTSRLGTWRQITESNPN